MRFKRLVSNNEAFNYRPQRSCGKVIFSQACVKNSVMGGVCLSACWDTHSPGQKHPPPSWADPLCPVHAGIDMVTVADGTHPTGMHSCWISLAL